MVHFDQAGKITQIRLYWDQGALLKQIDVIGARSRNWPIRDSKEQARLIASSSNSAAAAQPDSEPSSRRSTTSRGPDDVSITSRSRGSTNNAMNDPHASLSLFENRSVNDSESYTAQPIAARVQSAKPPPREYSELFVGEGSGSPSPSPQKIPTKAGGGKNYKANRLFEEDDEEIKVPGSTIKTNPKKYEHFAFGDGEDTPKVRDTARPIKTKGQASWDFEDFATPAKTKTKTHPQAVRHFGWSDDEVSATQLTQAQTLTKVNRMRDHPSAAPLFTRLVLMLIPTLSLSTTALQMHSARWSLLRVARATRVWDCTRTMSQALLPGMRMMHLTTMTSAP